MSALRAVVPDGEFPRAEIVAVRIARKVGPLFGVTWPQNPFGCTWVCDFTGLTLSEIARGAPLPTRQARGVAGSTDSAQAQDRGFEGWTWQGRAVVGEGGRALPTALPNATLNRYGPNTKAAVVLTGANRLLEPVTAVLTELCRDLHRRIPSPQVRLAAWAGLLVEVYRCQPALLVAAVQARAVQRSLTASWGSDVDSSSLTVPGARCEIGADGAPDAGQHDPVRLDVIDATFDALDLSDAGVTGTDRRDDVVEAWCRRLLHLGRPGLGIVWLADDGPHRRAHYYHRVGAVVAPFVAELLGPDTSTAQDRIPTWPAPSVLESASDALVQAHGLLAHAVVQYLRYVEDPTLDATVLLPDTRALIADARDALSDRLGSRDCASLLLLSYHEYLVLADALRADASMQGPQVSAAVQAVVAGQERTLKARRHNDLDPDIASYLLENANVLLTRVSARTDDTDLRRVLPRFWRAGLTSRALPPDPLLVLEKISTANIFHLSNYAQYLAERGPTGDLTKALRILDAVIEIRERVARDEPARLPVKYAALRSTRQSAARIAADLAQRLPARERTATARAWDAAHRNAFAVLTDPSTEDLLVRSTTDMTIVWLFLDIEAALRHSLTAAPGMWDRRRRSAAAQLIDRVLGSQALGSTRDGQPTRGRLQQLHDVLTSDLEE